MKRIDDDDLLNELKIRFEEYRRTIDQHKVLTNELKEANKRLEESEAMKSHFISNITNEIINPFTSIMALSKSILKVDKENWKKVISMIALIHSEAFNLDFQFRNIFVAAKIEAGEIYPDISKINLRDLIKNLVDDFKLEAKKKNLHIVVDIDLPDESEKLVYFKTDSEKLKLILSNLLFNAIKFSYNDEKIDIKVKLDNDDLVISVRDYGTGISEENQKIIFDRFKRIDSGINSLNRGHGLGLSINKALIDVLEGTIRVQTKIGEGSKFEIRIPESKLDVDSISMDDSELFFGGDEEIF